MWRLNQYEQRKTLIILPIPEYQLEEGILRVPIELLALADGSFLSFGCWHGIKHWEASLGSSDSLDFAAKVLIPTPRESEINRYGPIANYAKIKITLLKFGYLAYNNQDKSSKITILDLYAKNKKYIVQEFYPPHKFNYYFHSTSVWGDHLLVSDFSCKVSFYSLARLMQQRREERDKVRVLVQTFIGNSLTEIVESYYHEYFDPPPPTRNYINLPIFD